MAEDIAPALLEKVQREFHKNLEKAGATKKELLEKAKGGYLGSITQQSGKVGKALSRAYLSVLSPEILPDGIMYYNIAEKVMVPTIKEAYDIVSDVADTWQLEINKKMGIGIKPIRPPIEEDRLDGLLNAVSNGIFADNMHYLNEPIRNLVEHFSDNHTRENCRFLDSSGVKVYVTRVAEATACEWCQERAGVYDNYRDAQDNEVFARHEGCRCEVSISNGTKGGFMRAAGHAFVRSKQ